MRVYRLLLLLAVTFCLAINIKDHYHLGTGLCAFSVASGFLLHVFDRNFLGGK